MNELEIKALVSQVVDEMSNHTSEINKCKDECAVKIAELNQALKQAISEKNEIAASSQEIKAALEKLRAELQDLDKKYNEL